MRTLVTDIKKPLGAFHLERIRIIDEEDYGGVVRKVAEEGNKLGVQYSEEYLQRGVHALKQYYAVALLDPANAHAISAEVDPFWHAHILHSKQYMDFCQSTVGEYMHHVPLDRDDPAQMVEIRRLYNYTIRVLRDIFITVDESMWPAEPTDMQLICWHKGNQEIYPTVQPYRIYEPTPEGRAVVFV